MLWWGMPNQPGEIAFANSLDAYRKSQRNDERIQELEDRVEYLEKLVEKLDYAVHWLENG